MSGGQAQCFAWPQQQRASEMPKTELGQEIRLTLDSRIVIIGAGIAGVKCALGLRQHGHVGAIILLNEEAYTPYDRPPLSKAVLTGDADGDAIALVASGELNEAQIELRNGARCVGIDRVARTVSYGEETIGYDRLILATGSVPRELPGLEPGKPAVHYLRTLDDALRLRRDLQVAQCVVIVGAGVIGLEAAAACADGARRVVVIDPARRVMERAASPPLSALLESRHIAAGVELHLGSTISEAVPEGEGWAISLSDGTQIRADLVIIGIGVLPRSELAVETGLAVEPTGIVVDGNGRTSDPSIFAAGEVAFGFNGRLGRHDRQETWAHALNHGEHVAAAIMGQRDNYAGVSAYWTDQYDLAIQVFGECTGTRDIQRGDGDSFLIYHLRDDKVAGVTSVNAARDLRRAKKLVGERIADPALLAEPRVDPISLIVPALIEAE
ncbi:NAD(P)/FAD-dependent oxidoreductase [Novosphingobium aerophilum]|uniref:FAD-dependent oxidoreductase n=1 Tax=Novosphingobium aerophilum TaxID=2839843 RepID=A0A7X1FAP8_9SPHN|nr:FAD-dependent oxidoreductase [Novosphingobium aerophilum]MBC2653461.1 FAD-dependent oxidoreductase [Novosphingobium aerophilum]